MKETYREHTCGLMLLLALHHQLRPKTDPASVALRDRLEAAGENVLQGWRLLGLFLRALGVDTRELLADFWPNEAA